MNEKDFQNKIKQTIEKIVVNVGIGKMANSNPNFESKILPQIIKDLSLITGQYPKITKAKKSIAGFKVREGQLVGLQVTLRNKKMIDFFSRLVKIVLPRVRDFSGIPLSKIDQNGSINIGLKDQYVFPEINPEESIIQFPLGINIVSKIKNRKVAEETYLNLGFPFKIKK
ncbi:MAG: 50S ribosomal protein L5 [Patescibacteria group bacterium]|nr:50S ribosomal protein L5 [Patescibacteria group bacterium]MCX7589891.1 50S ribosomal protein L5 [Patescibacteria group bacterium]MDW8279572.1 50S ribosomal protein L5 [bacterium]